MAASALHERLVFDTANGAVLDASRRYVLLRADVLMGLFGALPEPARDVALQALGRSVATHGADSLRAYASEAGVDAAALQRTVEAAAASLGWGRWTLANDGTTLRLDVRNSPFAAAARPSHQPVCAAIAGMLEALATIVLGERASARETACAAAGAPCCRFSASIDVRPSSSFLAATQETSP
ncbi:MAG TPA: V4R domain-containing protein [Caldimonas sp.]|jgi:predicted hydrocarbon binding protein|nr:V4R domain-containing protein [Caldimonas sp.]HEX4234445.1 V4R domain-containing protein [Caldimonas sp.]